jgi:amidohydrolase
MTWGSRVDEGTEERLVAWRRAFHANPELSFEEYETTETIAHLLDSWAIPYDRPLATGVVAHLVGRDRGPIIAVRCDIDALPIHEENALPYASRVPGRMHACGHDGHAAVLLGLAATLSSMRDVFRGEIRLLFQPGEEAIRSGAREFIEMGVIVGVDTVIGVHLMSDLATGTISLGGGPIMASTDQFRITIVGSGGHGGYPHRSVDSLVIATSLVGELQTLVSRRVDPFEPAALTVGTIQGGSAFNVIAGTTELTGTVRTFSEDVRSLFERELRTVALGHAAAHGASATVSYERGHPTLINDAAVVRFLMPAAEAVVGSSSVTATRPVMAGEDFAFYSQAVPSAFAFVGTQNAAVGADFPHHHPRFDIDERSLGIALRFYLEALERSSGQEVVESTFPSRTGMHNASAERT